MNKNFTVLALKLTNKQKGPQFGAEVIFYFSAHKHFSVVFDPYYTPTSDAKVTTYVTDWSRK